MYMPRLTVTVPDIGQENDGHDGLIPGNSHNTLIDISALLSAYYGKLIRQGNVFKCSNFTFTLRQDDNLLNNEVGGAVSGFLHYYEPTKFRKSAWRYAFRECQKERMAHGKPVGNYDFRVAMHPDWPTVVRNAWIINDNTPLYLSGASQGEGGGIFPTWNHNADALNNDQGQPQDFLDFGSPVEFKDSDSEGDRDFTINDGAYFMQNNAREASENIPFITSFMGRIEDQHQNPTGINGPPHTVGSHYAMYYPSDINVLCGLIGVQIQSTAIDATGANDDITLDITFDVDKWTPISPRRKARRTKKGGTRRRRSTKRKSRRR